MLYEAARNLLLEEEEEERAKEAKAKEAEKAAGSASAPGAAAEAVEGAPIGASIGAPSAAAPAKTADELNDEFIQKGAFTLSYSTDPSLCTCAGVDIPLDASPSQLHAMALAASHASATDYLFPRRIPPPQTGQGSLSSQGTLRARHILLWYMDRAQSPGLASRSAARSPAPLQGAPLQGALLQGAPLAPCPRQPTALTEPDV